MEKIEYDEEKLLDIIGAELQASLGAPDSELSQIRLRNLQFYKAEAIGELSPSQQPDRSSIVSSDVGDTVEWMLPSLLSVFASSKDSLECEARAFEYREQAKTVAEYLKLVFWKRNQGFGVLYQWFKDALIQKVGIVKTYWEDEDCDEEETYRGLVPEQVDQLMKSGEIVSQSAYQVPTDLGDATIYDVVVKKKIKRGGVKICAVPPEEFRIHREARYGEEPLFLAHVYEKPAHELTALGYDLEGLSPGGSEFNNRERLERNDARQSWMSDSNSSGPLAVYECAECYIRLDYDGDGVAEWRRILRIGDKIFENEKVGEHPFAFFCPNPMPHTFFGNCPADFAIQPQKLSTALLRSLLDNVYLSVNQRVGVIDGEVNIDDLLNSRPQGIVRMKSAGAMVPIQQQGLDPSAWNMVEWAQQWREQRTGYTRQSNGLDPSALAGSNVGSYGVMAMADRADQRIELIARVAADSVRSLFEKILRCMGRYQSVADQVELFGQWVSIDPREWKDGFHLSINVGLGHGNKTRKAQTLQQILGMQQQFIQGGLITPEAAVLAARDFVTAAGLVDAKQYFPDPLPPDPNKKGPDQLKAEAEMQGKQFSAQQDAMRFQAESQLALEKLRIETQSAEKIETLKIQAAQQRTLLELAAGIMSSRNVGPTTNLINGTQLDQTAQSQAFDPQQVDETVQELLYLSNALQNQQGPQQ